MGRQARRIGASSPLKMYILNVYTWTMKKTRTFKSGNSVALRLPKALGIEAGIEMTVREERGRYVVERAHDEPSARKIDLSGIYGSLPPGSFRRDPDGDYEDIPREWHLLGLNPK